LLLKSLDPISHRRWRQVNAIAEFPPTDSCVMTHLSEDSSVNCINS
jgi:hypothetical protein